MSSLSMGIYEQGIEKGEEEGREEVVLDSHEEGLPIPVIAKITRLSEERVKQIIEGNKDTEAKEMRNTI